MKVKKALVVGTIAVLVSSLLASNVAFANEVIIENNVEVAAVAEAKKYMSDGAMDESSVKIKKDKAVEIAKTMLDDPKNYDVVSLYLSPKWPDGGSIWVVEFRNKKGLGGGLNVDIDGDNGKIRGFNRWDAYDGSQNFVAQYTREEARKLAEEYLQRTLGIDIKNYELQKESPYASYYKIGGVKETFMYDFTFVEKINDIPFLNSIINVGIDGTSGRIMNYYFSNMDIDKGKLPSGNNVITSEEALEKYKKYSDVVLQYTVFYKDQAYGMQKPIIKLAYVPSTYISMVDALTGEGINYDGSVVKGSYTSLLNFSGNIAPLKPDAVLSSKTLTEEEVKTKAENAKKIVEQLLGVSFQTDNTNYYGTYYRVENSVWTFNWSTMTEKGDAYFNISINEKTGHITNISLGNYNYTVPLKEDGTPKEVIENISWEQGKEKAVTVLKQLLPEQYGFFGDQNNQKPEYSKEINYDIREHNYSFVRIVNGLSFFDNSIGISIDRETGDIRNMYFNWIDADFPSIDNIIDREKAIEIYFGKMKPRLAYQLLMPYDSMSSGNDFTENIKLGYSFYMDGLMYNGVMVDALTGKIIDWTGSEFVPETAVTDLPDHWAKRSIELLKAQGILKGADIKYDAPVTRAEAVKMLSLAKGMMYYGGNTDDISAFKDVSLEDDYYAYIESAVRNKIIYINRDEFKGDEKITKEEFIKMLVNLIGYQDIAKKNEIFKTGHERNVSSDARGYVAICRALDALPVKNGEVLDGKAILTYAEAAKALYSVLPYIK